MLKAYIKLEKRYIILMILLILLHPVLTGGITNIANGLIFAHFPTLILNNLYILLIYRRICFFNSLRYLIIPRIGKKLYFITNLIFSIFSFLFYYLVLTVFFCSVYIIRQEDMPLLIVFCILNFFLYLIFELLMLFQLNKEKSLVYVIIPIILNLYFHYGIVLNYF